MPGLNGGQFGPPPRHQLGSSDPRLASRLCRLGLHQARKLLVAGFVFDVVEVESLDIHRDFLIQGRVSRWVIRLMG